MQYTLQSCLVALAFFSVILLNKLCVTFFFVLYTCIFEFRYIDILVSMKNIHSKGAFGRAFFLWQRSIVTETMANYLRLHTAKKMVKETLLQNLCYRIFVCFAGLAKGRGCLVHITSLINASKPVKAFSTPIS